MTQQRSDQMALFRSPSPSGRARRRARNRPPVARPGRREQLATQLDALAAGAERECREHRRSGDAVRARAAHDRAVGARRAAEVLRAGPGGVAELIERAHPEAA